VEACGICHTDVATVTGTYPGLTLPRVPGHEVVGPALKPSVAERLDGKSVNGLVSA
jgi:D-arabinose 1-dehydrogenase-like Zn-dependent alcohol dehydrogenase